MSQPTHTAPTADLRGAAYDASLIAQLVPHLRTHKRLVWLAIGLMPITIAFELAQPYLVKLAFERHLVPRDPTGMEWILAAFLGCVLLQGISSYFEQWAMQLLGQRTMHDLRLATYDHIMRQRVSFFDRIAVGRLTTRVTSDIESINEMFAQGVVTMFADLLRMLAILVIMLSLDVTLSIIVLLSFPFLWLVVAYARRAMRSSFRAIRQRLAAMNGHAFEHLSGIRVVHSLGRQADATAEYDVLNAGHRDAYVASIRADAVMYAIVEMIGVFAIAAVGWWLAGHLGPDASMVRTLGIAVVFIEYGNKFFLPIRDLSAKYTVMQSAMAALERLRQLMTHNEPDAPRYAAGDATPPRTSTSSIEFDDVHFGYRKEDPILRGVSWRIARGATVAVVGTTGSGKSTLIRLLTRLYEVDRGTIFLDGQDIRSFDGPTLRRRISVITQDAFFIAGSLRANLTLGCAAGDEELQQALKQLGADRILEQRGLTLDSIIEERGANLSAGERQLIAFARALVRHSEVLILDEATAHVDPETEQALESGLARLAGTCTTIIIAHRLQTIRRADEVIVMQRGTIAERGSYEQLLASQGIFARLVRQFAQTRPVLPSDMS